MAFWHPRHRGRVYDIKDEDLTVDQESVNP